jgi:hypothetical protein
MNFNPNQGFNEARSMDILSVFYGISTLDCVRACIADSNLGDPRYDSRKFFNVEIRTHLDTFKAGFDFT